MVALNPEAIEDFMRNGVAWNPQPLRRELKPDEYPVAYLPPVIADAAREVEGYMQAPMAMVAACALSVVSAAVQARFSVQRDAVLQGPASLYLMTVAASGERKTSSKYQPSRAGIGLAASKPISLSFSSRAAKNFLDSAC